MIIKDYLDLPIISIDTYVTYYCPDGYQTSDLKEAEAHGYGTGRSTMTTFGHRDAFERFDYSGLPVIDKFSMVLEKNYGVYTLTYYCDREQIMRQEVWYTSEDMQDGKLPPLVGTAKNPYNYIDQGVDEYIFERDGFVMVLSAMNWESFSNSFTGFRVKADEFYQIWNKMPIPEPYR